MWETMALLRNLLFTCILLLQGLGKGEAASIPGPRSDTLPDLFTATTEELGEGLRAGHFSSVELVRAYAARIADVNDTLHAVTELNPDAIAVATQLDVERAAGQVRGPLHGLVYLVKNNIGTDDAMNNTAGSYALLGSQQARAAGVVVRLRAAGAIIVGKANLSQWAGFRSSSMWADHRPDNSSNGWSAYGGQVYGAYWPQQDPLGSSSGPAVGVSVGLALAALGTETVGSIVDPSSRSNCVGIKPSVGLTSRAGVVPFSSHQDSVGPIARTVRDAAYLLQAIAGPDPNDNYTSAIPNGGTLPDYVAACKMGALKGARLGVPRNLIFPERALPPVLAAFEAALDALRAAGATIVDNANVTDAAATDNESGDTQLRVLEADFASALPAYLAGLVANPHDINTLEDLRNFTRAYPLEYYPDRDTGLWDLTLNASITDTDPSFWPLYQRNLDLVGPQGIAGVMANYSLDALVLPTDFGPYFPARLGTPLVTVPASFYPDNQTVAYTNRGLVSTAPGVGIGLSFLGKRWDEETIIGYAYDYEQSTQVRSKVQPYIKPSSQIQPRS